MTISTCIQRENIFQFHVLFVTPLQTPLQLDDRILCSCEQHKRTSHTTHSNSLCFLRIILSSADDSFFTDFKAALHGARNETTLGASTHTMQPASILTYTSSRFPRWLIAVLEENGDRNKTQTRLSHPGFQDEREPKRPRHGLAYTHTSLHGLLFQGAGGLH